MKTNFKTITGKHGVYSFCDERWLTASDTIRAINNNELELVQYFSRLTVYIHRHSLKPTDPKMIDEVIDLKDSAKATI